LYQAEDRSDPAKRRKIDDPDNDETKGAAQKHLRTTAEREKLNPFEDPIETKPARPPLSKRQGRRGRRRESLLTNVASGERRHFLFFKLFLSNCIHAMNEICILKLYCLTN
jgi:hypothetical protein